MEAGVFGVLRTPSDLISSKFFAPTIGLIGLFIAGFRAEDSP
jgi:hypothetical protein